jgi:hypothetical protein
MNARLPGAALQRFRLAGTQEDARGFSVLERPLVPTHPVAYFHPHGLDTTLWADADWIVLIPVKGRGPMTRKRARRA